MVLVLFFDPKQRIKQAQGGARRVGRPSDKELKIRISAEDKERIRFKMEESGILNMSAYVRKMALDGICVKLDLTEVRQLIVLLQRCSNNLNQYANETGNVYAADIEDLQRRLDEIWELSRQSLAHLANIR